MVGAGIQGRETEARIRASQRLEAKANGQARVGARNRRQRSEAGYLESGKRGAGLGLRQERGWDKTGAETNTSMGKCFEQPVPCCWS